MRQLIFTCVALAALSVAACKSDKSASNRRHPATVETKEAFAQKVLTALRARRPQTRYDYHADSFSIAWSQGERKGMIYLNNAYDEYRERSGSVRQHGLDQFISASATLPGEGAAPLSSAAGKRQLLPQVRTLAYREAVAASAAKMGGKASDFGTPLAEHLFVCIVRDSPNQMAYLSTKQLDKAHTSRAKAMTIALRNLRARSAGTWKRPQDGVQLWQSPWRDNYDAARLLLPDLIRKLAVKGDPIVMVPHRDVLLVTGSEDATGLREMAKLAEATLRGSRPMSGVAFRLDQKNQWKPWLPATGHPAYATLHRVRTMYLLSIYDPQTQSLNKHGKDGPFAAKYMVYRNKHEHDAVFSVSVLSKGVDTLLPETDRIMFFHPAMPKGKQLRANARWADVVAAFGGHMKKLDVYPPRYRVDSFPTAAQLRKLGMGSWPAPKH